MQISVLAHIARGGRLADWLGTRGRAHCIQQLRARGLLASDSSLTELGNAAAALAGAILAAAIAADRPPAPELEVRGNNAAAVPAIAPSSAPIAASSPT